MKCKFGIKLLFTVIFCAALTGTAFSDGDEQVTQPPPIENTIISINILNPPAYILDQKDASFEVDILYTGKGSETYEIKYTLDDWKTSETFFMTAKSGLRITRQVRLDLPKGVYTIQVTASAESGGIYEYKRKIGIIDYHIPKELEKYSRIGVHCWLRTNGNITKYAEENKIDMKLMDLAGIRIVRPGQSFDWTTSQEPKEGTYAFNRNIGQIAGRLKELGFTLIGGGNSLYNKLYGENGAAITKRGNDGYVNWINATQNYLPMKYMVLQNEPDLSHYFPDDPSGIKLANRLRIVWLDNAIRTPYATIMGGSPSGVGAPFMKKFMTQDVYSYLFHFDFHPYIWTTFDKYYLNHLKTYEEVVKPYGDWVKKSITEVAWRISDAEGDRKLDAEGQADNYVKTMVVSDFRDYEFTCWYVFRAYSAAEDTSFATLENDFTVKPIFIAQANTTKILNTARYVGYIKLDGKIDAHVYVKDGKPFIVAWCSSGTADYDFGKNVCVSDKYGNPLDYGGAVPFDSSVKYIENISKEYLGLAAKSEITYHLNNVIESYGNSINTAPLEKVLGMVQNGRFLNGDSALEVVDAIYNAGKGYIKDNKETEALQPNELALMLFEIHKAGQRAASFYGETVGKTVEASAETVNRLTAQINSKKNNERFNSLLYTDKIFNYASDYNAKAVDINSMKFVDGKNGWVAYYSIMASKLCMWAGEMMELEEPKNIAILTYSMPVYFETYQGMDKEVVLTVDNKYGSHEIKGELMLLDDEDKIVGEPVNLDLNKGEYINVPFNVQTPLSKLKGSYTYNYVIVENGKEIMRRSLPVTIKSIISVKLEHSTQTMNKFSELKLTFTNETKDVDFDGTLEIKAPDGWELESNSISLSVKAAEQKTITVPVLKTKRVKFNEYCFTVSVSQKDGKKILVENKAQTFLVVAENKTEIDLDEFKKNGDISAFEDAYPIYVNPPLDPTDKEQWHKSDVAVKAFLKWDKNYFYFLADVYDDAFTAKENDRNLWKYDSVQFAIDTLNNKGEALQSDDLDYGVARMPIGTRKYCFQSPGGDTAGNITDTWIAVLRDDEKCVTRYLIKFPDTLVYPMSLSAETQFAFNFCVNDADMESRDIYVQLSKGFGEGKRIPKYYNTFVLRTYEIGEDAEENPLVDITLNNSFKD